MATLRRLALSVLFTIMTTSYQTTCIISETTFNKRQHANARYRVESLTLYALRHHVLGPGNKWIDAFITGTTDSGRSYETQVEATGKQLTRNRSHIRPRSPDIPHMHASFLQRNTVPSATSDGNAPSERQNTVISATVREVSNKPIHLRS